MHVFIYSIIALAASSVLVLRVWWSGKITVTASFMEFTVLWR